MKNRAQRMDNSEDWVDESWTVDCVCGVNFDDGEEMVDCDECGVWVHTRCSRYVKGEKSFSCDKCKIKNSRNNSEETEVAQLLVDLPKNTMKMEDSYRLNDASRRPLRLLTEKPMEDRVHVHGVPGGDPQLFAGLSGIFTPQLWKAAGYVPKKFNFRYREFPCWDQDEEKTSIDQLENPSPLDTGANALYSMSKETLFGTRLRLPLGTRVSGKGENFDTKVDANEPKSMSHVNLNVEFSNDDSENEKSTHHSSVFKSSQQRKDLITSQNRTGKRKSRATDKDIDGKKRLRHSSGTGYSTASNPKIKESSRDTIAKHYRKDSQSAMKYSGSDDVPRNLVLKSSLPREDSCVKAKKYPNSDRVLEASPGDAANGNSATEALQKVEKVGSEAPTIIDGDIMTSSSLVNNVEQFSLKKEVVGSVSCIDTDQRENSENLIINKADIKLPSCSTHPAVPQIHDSQNFQDSTVSRCNQIQRPKLEADSLCSSTKKSGDGLKHLINHSLVGPDPLNCKVDRTVISSLNCNDKEHVVQEKSNALNFYANASDEFNDTSISPKLESSEGCKTLNVTSLEKNKFSSVQPENHTGTGEAAHSPTLLPSQRKMVVSVARSMSTNSVFKSVASDDSRAEENRNSGTSNRKKAATTSNMVKERGVSVADKDVERPQKNRKESPVASETSVWKSSHFDNSSRSHMAKESFSRSKDRESRSIAKERQDNIVTSDSGESAGSQAQGASLGQSKVTSSGSSGSLQKGRKHSLITHNTSSKTSNVASTNRHLLSASHALLSDEELALLLHQELNSSPRVPRIPRMRQAGSLPQSASPTAANTLSKRTSSFRGNDFSSVSRKYKDPSGDGTHLSDELDVKSRKGEKRSSQNQCIKVDGNIEGELDERSSKTYGVVKRKGPSISVTKSHSSSRNSLKNVFDEEIGVERSPTYRTLPGLISEIMSKGKRMTYEELCNAVLPHWHNLRKHNGERYAYSSHSQAVLDCLRNRSEWAQLVDRGPKTNPGRKRRKLDAEPATSESEDGMREKNKSPSILDNRSISKPQDFPKGKRKARKRRRLALQNKEVKDLRKSRSVETISEDDDGEDDSLYSNSMEQSSSSGDDAQESGSVDPASEASVSSDES